jgi:group I intron endonuclease
MALYLRENEIMLLEDTKAYLYRWTHIPTGKWYVGSRTAKGSHPQDGYYCSSKVVKPLIQQNPKEWNREILAIGEPLYIRDLENKYLIDINAAKDPMSFNKTNADGKFHRTGISHTADTKQKLSKALTGRNHSDETRAQMSKTRLGSGNPMFGKNLSDITKQKLSKSVTGFKHTDIAKSKITAAQTGRARSEKARKSISVGVSSLEKIKCEHCGGLFSPALYGRWHGDKCKSRGTPNE